MSVDPAARLAEVRQRIEGAAARAGRDPDAITLVAVTKKHPLALIQTAYDAGLRHFGENRVEEAGEKFTDLGDHLPEAVWHMIGHIQSRKTSDVAESRFRWVHSVDRYKIARRLNDARPADPLNVFFQANVSGEQSKYGYDLAGWPSNEATFQRLVEDIQKAHQLDGLRIRGLMTLAPYSDNPEDARPTFRRLRHLRDALAERLPEVDLGALSMGMSADYEVAIEEGATHIRLGTAIFGARQY
jgi:hypothetical protein